jgi:hypothetical protein
MLPDDGVDGNLRLFDDLLQLLRPATFTPLAASTSRQFRHVDKRRYWSRLASERIDMSRHAAQPPAKRDSN